MTKNFILRFISDLETLLEGGLSLDKALDIIEKENKNKHDKKIISKIKLGILYGKSLSSTLENLDHFFPEFLVAIVRVAEKSGTLPRVLKEARLHLEETTKFKNKIKIQLIYPGIVIFISFLILIFLGFFVFPNFLNIFEQNNLSLPFFTKLIFDIFKFIKNNFIIIIAVFFGGIITTKNLPKKEIDKILLKLPVLSKIIKKITISHFCQTMAVLLESGATILDATYISLQTIGNEILRKKFSIIPYWLNHGLSLKNTFEKVDFLPERLKQIICIAEETGSLARAFSISGRYYQQEFEKELKTIVAIFEPVFTLIVGGLVALVVVAVFLPLISLTSALNI